MKITPREDKILRHLYLNGKTKGTFFKGGIPNLISKGLVTHVSGGIYALTKSGSKLVEGWPSRWREPR